MTKEIEIKKDEILSDPFSGKLKYIQPLDGYRISVDSLVLASFTRDFSGERVIDLGTGNGILLVLIRNTAFREMVGIEIQTEMADRALRNMTLNGLTERTRIIIGDIRHIKKLAVPHTFDLVVSNPPYYRVENGRTNENQEKALARHEIVCNTGDILSAAKYLVKPDGRIYLIYPARRLCDVIMEASSKKLSIARMRFVHSFMNGPCKMVLFDLRKDPGMETLIMEPFVIYDAPKQYGGELARFIENL